MMADSACAVDEALRGEGILVLPSFLAADKVDALSTAVDDTLAAWAQIQDRRGMGAETRGTAHHILRRDSVFLKCLEWLEGTEVICGLEKFLGGKIILNSFGCFDNLNAPDSYVSDLHRDVRFWTREQPLMAQILVMLDAFTEENGATYLLANSQHAPHQPDAPTFLRDAIRAIGPPGSLLIFDSRVWHAAGRNATGLHRRCLTITFTRAFFKPQFDYCRSLGYEYCATLPESLKQVLGFYARIPATLDEWYLPPADRFYRRDQDRS